MAQAETRRRAVEILAGTLASAALSGFSWAQDNYPCRPGRFECKCPSAAGRFFRLCCPDGYTCRCVPTAAVCARDRCSPDKTCGDRCCPTNRVCCDAASSLCCEQGEKCGSYGDWHIC